MDKEHKKDDHVDDVWLFDLARNCARSDEDVDANQTEWTNARIRGMMWTENRYLNIIDGIHGWCIPYKCSLSQHVPTHA